MSFNNHCVNPQSKAIVRHLLHNFISSNERNIHNPECLDGKITLTARKRKFIRGRM